MKQVNKRLIYIGGVGRTGSTVLAGIIHRYTGGLNTGELIRLNYYYKSDDLGICSCGKEIKDCEIYSGWEEDKKFRTYIIDRYKTVIDSSKFIRSFLKWMSIYKGIDEIIYVHLSKDRKSVVNSVIKNIGPGGKKSKIKANLGWLLWSGLSFSLYKVLPKVFKKIRAEKIHNCGVFKEKDIAQVFEKYAVCRNDIYADHQIDGNYRYR